MELTNPAIIFLGVWLSTYALFSLHLSALLINDHSGALALIFTVSAPFITGFIVVTLLHKAILRSAHSRTTLHEKFRQSLASNYHSLRRKIAVLSCIWAAIEVFEIGVSRGVPLYWLITGSSRTYFDFGVHSLHGFVNSLLLATVLISFALYFYSRERIFLIMPMVSVVWAIIVVSRNLLLVNLAQCFILWLRFYARNVTKILLKSLIFGVAILYVFGLVGDMRTGARNFLALAQPTISIPRWAPSGFFWAYIYVTTPMNNLLFNELNVHPLDDGTFPNTFSLLIPSVLRNEIIPKSKDPSKSLVTQAFNVSSAFIGPYQDAGIPAVMLYALILGIVCTFFWLKRTFFGFFTYCVLAQCLFFSNFFNHFLYLPIIFQVFWFFIYRLKFKPRQETNF